MTDQKSTRIKLLALCLSCTAFIATAQADPSDPPSRIARIAYISGSISFQPAGTQDWVAAPLNRPLSTGDTVWAADNGRAELQLDGSAIRLTNSSELGIVNLNDDVTQVQLSSGTLILRVRRLHDNETYEVDTPNLAFSVLRAGVYRISVDPAGNTTSILVHDGEGEATGAGSAYTVEPGSYDVFSGSDQLTAQSEPDQPPPDDFDSWSTQRDGHWDHLRSAQYVSPEVIGYEDLDDHGTWQTTSDYGPVWYPSGVAPGWAPYQAGHWSYIAPWGYTWVDDQPWGFAPFHYGRWIWGGGAWGWIPARPRPPRGDGWVRPVYAPALVAWVGAGAGVAWFALGPREVYVPSYPVSQNYVRNINVSNTTVNKTVINNVYNTTIINNKTVNVTYINRGAPGAVTATTAAAFTSAQPVARNLVKMDQREIERSPNRARAPAVVPTREAVLGSGRPSSARPPAAVQARTVVARTAPPAAPLPFEQRLQAIKNNGGRPLSAQQVRDISPAAAPARSAPVRLAAPIAAPIDLPRPAVKPGQPNQAPALAQRAQAPASHALPAPMQVSPQAPQAVHARELPPPPKVPSPNVANTAMDREHLQQQQQMRAQQEGERRRIQQQQEAEHQRLAKQQADQARAQQLEQQRQQQAQQQQQQRAQAQQADQARAKEADRQRQQQAQQAQQQRAQEQQAAQAKAQELERQHQQQTQQLQQQQIQAQQALQAKQQEQRRAPPKPNDPHRPAS